MEVWVSRVAALAVLVALVFASLSFLHTSLPSLDHTAHQPSTSLPTNQISCEFEDQWLAEEELISFGNSSSPFLVLPPVKEIKHLQDLSSERKMILLAMASSASFRFFELREGREIPLAKDSISNQFLDVTRRFCSQTSSRKLTNPSEVASSAVSSVKIQINSLGAASSSSPKSGSLFHQREGILHQEEYFLEIHSDSIVICVVTPIALQYALATLSQLLDGPNPIPSPVLLHDWPDNRWRGLLVDVARHFMPLSLLKRTVDGMAAVKFNTLHLHLTDSQVPSYSCFP